MFVLYIADMPSRDVRAEEIRFCKACQKKTKHRYEEISFHAKMFFVNVLCYKKRYVRICSVCNNGEEMEKDQFDHEVDRLIYPDNVPNSDDSPSSNIDDAKVPAYRVGKKKGLKYCRQCGEKIFPDIGYCTACAVRGQGQTGQSKDRKRR